MSIFKSRPTTNPTLERQRAQQAAFERQRAAGQPLQALPDQPVTFFTEGLPIEGRPGEYAGGKPLAPPPVPTVVPGADQAAAIAAAGKQRKRAALGGLRARPLPRPGALTGVARTTARALIGY